MSEEAIPKRKRLQKNRSKLPRWTMWPNTRACRKLIIQN